MSTKSKNKVSDSNNNVDILKKSPTSVNLDTETWTLLQVIFGCFSIGCLFYSVYTSVMFMGFLSGHMYGRLGIINIDDQLADILFKDMILLVMFCFLHSILATDFCKALFFTSTLKAAQRSIYLIVTGLSLQYLQTNWVSSSYTVWNFISLSYASTICSIVHAIAWIFILLAMSILDMPEFFGITQVSEMNNGSCPFQTKTVDVKRYLSNSRHSTIIGLLLVFWFVPCMTVDRLLLATVFSIYIFTEFYAHTKDYKYVKRMYAKKHKKLH